MNQRTGENGGGNGDFLKRSMYRIRAFSKYGFLAVMVVAFATSAAWAVPSTPLFVFGDSLSDVGNEHLLHGNVLPPDYNYRNSNGPLWVDLLATKLGSAPLTASQLGGTNYAYGGAETLNNSWAPNLGEQVSTYLGTAGVANPNAVYVVWMGSNDFLKTYPRTGSFPTTAAMNLWANEVSGAVSTLYGAGARNFVVPNLVPLANVPAMSALSPYKNYFNSLVSGFNTDLFGKLHLLESNLDGLNIQKLDTYKLLSDVVANPSKYGFENVTERATVKDPSTGEEQLRIDPTTGLPVDPDKYLFWDDVHPTARAHALLAQAVPEPSAIAMLVVGSMALLVWTRVRRR